MPRTLASILLSLVFTSLASAQTPAGALTPAQSLAKIKVPEGFKVTLFAGEPDVVQPIAFAIDDRGRLWVVECLSYPTWNEKGSDRIVIFEDTDGDGRFDKKKTFWDKGRYLTGIQLGFGGVYICNAPDLAFIPDKDGDDVPDAEPTVLLDGWSTKGKHNVLNALKWGPDGWLYGCNGITAPSKVGKPGTADKDRVEINCGVWRYHPTKHIFEVVAHGTTNPWGLDWDEYGQMFVTNCVIKHIFHITPGGHYERMFGEDINKYSYGLMQSCADHIHWAAGTKWTDSRGGKGAHDGPGGGHAHAGLMIYQGDNWPKEYRGNAFICNVHGGRVNRDTLTTKGSGYVATHGKDFLFANDDWFRGLEMQYGPSGEVYMTDWHDTGECHDYDKAETTTGRIYKITFGDVKPVNLQLAKKTHAELVELQFQSNEWLTQRARRILHERYAAGILKMETVAGEEIQGAIKEKLWFSKNEMHRLRALWLTHILERPDFLGYNSLMQDEKVDPRIRGWAIRLGAETDEPQIRIVVRDLGSLPSAHDRLAVAAAMQRMSFKDRWWMAAGLVKFAEDANDPNIPLMIWYGIEPAVVQDREEALKLAAKSKIPILRQYIAQRIAALTAPPPKKDDKKDGK